VPPPPNGEIWRELKRLGDDCERHEKDLYRGNGLPGITTRMANAEKSINALQDILHEMKTQRDTKMNLVLGGIITLIAGWALAHFKLI
jgi:hypothetical protein